MKEAAERYKERTGEYSQRILKYQIDRTRENWAYCKERRSDYGNRRLEDRVRAIRIDKKIEYQDNTDRIEVEKAFSLSKRHYGMGLIVTKLERHS